MMEQRTSNNRIRLGSHALLFEPRLMNMFLVLAMAPLEAGLYTLNLYFWHKVAKKSTNYIVFNALMANITFIFRVVYGR